MCIFLQSFFFADKKIFWFFFCKSFCQKYFVKNDTKVTFEKKTSKKKSRLQQQQTFGL